jgi:uncharacterized protein involved in type VI secretion and phage assembly
MITDDLILEVLERVRGRFYGKYRGSVIEIEENGRGRIKAKVPAVLKDTPTGWCDPCVPYAGDGVGIVFLPEVGSGVWIEFEGGDPSFPIWTGCYWRDGEFPAAASASKKLIQTKAGHQLLLDDEEQSIQLTDSNENTITLDQDGITLVRGSGKLQVSDSETNINDGAMEVLA